MYFDLEKVNIKAYDFPGSYAVDPIQLSFYQEINQ